MIINKLKTSYTSILKYGVALGVMIFLAPQVYSQSVTNNIRLNQIGFYPGAPKIAIVLTDKGQTYTIESADGKIVFTGGLKQSVMADLSGKKTWIADFSALHQSGTYILNINGYGKSYPFNIQTNINQKIAGASIKAFYYQRASIALPGKYAGVWHRPEGHPDNVVLIHPSAAGTNRPAGSLISSPGGWYDAGDYNKYIVNSGITMGTLLSLYEDFPDHMQAVDLNIPESGNHIPDVLNEVLWNLRWMLTMQDPEDGGVYHKLTNAAFDAMVMPGQALSKRYVVQKSTAAALEFSAVMAQSARIFKKFGKECPGLSDSCLSASVKAWQWAMNNKNEFYDQDRINRQYQPQITTGTYANAHFADELIWAACELYITTGDISYYKITKLIHDNTLVLPSWGQVKLLGYYSLFRNRKLLTGDAKDDMPEIITKVLAFNDMLIRDADGTAFKTVMGKNPGDFNWGSNGTAANQGVALVQAYLLTKNNKYLNYALSNLDYLLGRNGTGYAFITGYGSKSPMHPHHRPSIADGIVEPIPGLLVGGPNSGMQDGMKYTTTIPNQMYMDDDRAYAINEVAINWNAPFAYLVNAIEAIHTQDYRNLK